METLPQQSELDSAWKNSLRIWQAGFGFLPLSFVFAFVLQPLKGQVVNENSSSAWLGYLIYALLGVAALNLLLVPLFRRAILKPDKTGQQSAARKYIRATSLTTSLLEGIGMYGVIAFILTGKTFALPLFLGIAVAGMFLFKPNKDILLDLDRQTQGTVG